MGIYVFSRMQVEDDNSIDFYCGNGPKYVISVTDPRSKDAKIKAGWIVDILRFQFSDIDNEIEGAVMFTPEMAQQIVGFFIGIEDLDTAEIIVHCEAGISRNAGIAAAIARWWGWDEQFFFDHYLPNRHFYRLVLEAFHSED